MLVLARYPSSSHWFWAWSVDRNRRPFPRLKPCRSPRRRPANTERFTSESYRAPSGQHYLSFRRTFVTSARRTQTAAGPVDEFRLLPTSAANTVHTERLSDTQDTVLQRRSVRAGPAAPDRVYTRHTLRWSPGGGRIRARLALSWLIGHREIGLQRGVANRSILLRI